MKAIWVYENITGYDNFYSKFNITLLVTSACLWRKYHPNHKLELYLDEQTFNKFLSLDILNLWHDVKPLDYKDRINRQVLWAGCKSKIVSKATEPFAIIDHDFLIFNNIDEYLKDSVIYTHDEDMSAWYIEPRDEYNQKLTNPIEYTQDLAANVSFLYLPDPSFAQKYGNRVIQNLTEFTSLLGENINPGYMTMSEQYMLKNWLVKFNIKHKTLSKNIFSCKDIQYSQNENDRGIWNLSDSSRYFKHYGINKRKVLDDRPDFGYNETMSFLYRCINASKTIDVDYFNSKLLNNINQR